jgi:hypothetical protein
MKPFFRESSWRLGSSDGSSLATADTRPSVKEPAASTKSTPTRARRRSLRIRRRRGGGASVGVREATTKGRILAPAEL